MSKVERGSSGTMDQGESDEREGSIVASKRRTKKTNGIEDVEKDVLMNILIFTHEHCIFTYVSIVCIC